MTAKKTADLIYQQAAEIGKFAVDLHYRKVPELATRYGPKGKEKCLQDAGYHLSYLAEAIIAQSPLLFKEYVGWAQQMLAARNIPAQDLAVNLNCIKEALAQRLSMEQYKTAAQYLNAALSQLEISPGPVNSFLEKETNLKEVAGYYVELLLAGKRNEASRLVLELADNNTPIKELYLQVFQPAQYEVGRLWQLNQISVAQEHYCTAATQMIMSQLYPYFFDSERNGLRLVAGCVAGDQHEIGVRMVADFFEMEGWDTFYLGANTPIDSIIKTLKEQKAHILLLSATMAYHVRAVADVIQKVRKEADLQHVKVMVGGYPFNAAPELWEAIGADAWARTADEALEKAKDLVALNPSEDDRQP